MNKLVSSVLLLILVSNTIIHASSNPKIDHCVQCHVDQARFLIQNGISQEEVLKIFKDGLKDEKLCADKPKSNKILWTIAGCCVVAVVIGGTYYFLVKKQTQNTPPQQQPTPLNQQLQQNQPPSQPGQPAPNTQQTNPAPNASSQQRAIPQELRELFDDNAFNEVIDRLTNMAGFIDMAEEHTPAIRPLYHQALEAARNRDLAAYLQPNRELGQLADRIPEEIRDAWQDQNPAIVQRIENEQNQPHRMRRNNALDRFFDNH